MTVEQFRAKITQPQLMTVEQLREKTGSGQHSLQTENARYTQPIKNETIKQTANVNLDYDYLSDIDKFNLTNVLTDTNKTSQQDMFNKYNDGYKAYNEYVKQQDLNGEDVFDIDSLRSAYVGIFPSTNVINPLQAEITNVDYRSFTKGHGKLPPTVANTKYQLYDKRNGQRLFEIENHPIKTGTPAINHINTKPPKDANILQRKLADKIDHKYVSQEFYDTFRNFDEVVDNVKFAGKAIAAAGVILEAVEFADTVYEDLNDKDGKLGKKTVKVSAGITGDWAGGLIGAKIGATGGAAIGSNILMGPGTVIGGFIGGIIGGVAGSIAGRDTMENWVEKHYIGD